MSTTKEASATFSACKQRGRSLLGWTAIVASILYFVSDALEAAHGGFTNTQLWLTLVAEAAIPAIVIGLYWIQRPHMGVLGAWGAFIYAYSFVYFTGTVVYALVEHTPDFDQLGADLGPAMTLHGILMMGAALVFAYAVVRAGVLPRWTGALFGVGVVAVAVTAGFSVSIELFAVGTRDAAIVAMGWAVIRTAPLVDREIIASGAMYRTFLATVATTDLAPVHGDPRPVVEADLPSLPDTVQRYLRFMGVVGRPRDWSLQACFIGRFRRGPNQSWMPTQAWQYNTATPVARVFHMRARFLHVVSMIARDTYVREHGRMLGKVFDRFVVVDGSGDEFDIGELSTFLNDAILLAPSMLLGANATWSEVDDGAFDVSLTDGPRTVTARVSVDRRGAPSDFSTTDRFAAFPSGLKRARWSTPIEAWNESGDRPVPTAAKAIWHLPDGPFTYIEGRFLPGSIRYNVSVSGNTPNESARHGDHLAGALVG